MNKLTIIGNVCAKPELRTTQTGKAVCGFTVAVNGRKREGQDAPEATFFRVNAWERQAENCAKYLDKGSKVAIVGSVSCRTYQANNGETRASLEVQAQEVEFLTRAAEQASPQTDAMQEAAEAYARTKAQQYTPVDPEDLPF